MLEHLDSASERPGRVVVSGATGFVGGAVVRRLRAAGIEVVALGRAEADLLAPEGAAALAARLRPGDSFVAAAAVAPVKTLEMLEANVALLRATIRALSEVPPRHVLNIGSDAVFADEPVPLTEASAKAPGTLHGVMHLAREIAFAGLPCPVATLRPTLIYGAADPHNGYGPNRFRRLAEKGEDIVLFGEGEERRDHVWIEDVAELAVRILCRRSRGSLNAATGEVWSFREVAALVAGLFPRRARVRGAPRQGPMPHNGYRPFDPAATFAAFPDFRYTPLPEGLAKVHAGARNPHHA